jgi:uncharacterized DUF497 family protein
VGRDQEPVQPAQARRELRGSDPGIPRSAVSVSAGRIEGGEARWQTLGLVEGLLLLTVAHTVREERDDGTSVEVIRIIAARPATRKERRRYMKTKMVSYTLDNLGGQDTRIRPSNSKPPNLGTRDSTADQGADQRANKPGIRNRSPRQNGKGERLGSARSSDGIKQVKKETLGERLVIRTRPWRLNAEG